MNKNKNLQRVYQTDTSAKGDCLQAAIASLTNWELDEIPNFQDAPDWRLALYRWIQPTSSAAFIQFSFPRELETFLKYNHFQEGYVIAVVESFHHAGERNHAVCAYMANGKIEIKHDPNPLNHGRVTADYRIIEIVVFFGRATI